MEQIVASVVASSTPSSPEEVVRALNLWLPKFRAEYDARLASESRTLWEGLISSDQRFRSAIGDRLKNLEISSNQDFAENLEESNREQISDAFVTLSKSFNDDLAERLAKLEARLVELKAENDEYFTELGAPATLRSDSPLDLVLTEQKLKIAADLSTVLPEEPFIGLIREIYKKLLPVVSNPPSDPLDLLEASFPFLTDGQRAAVVHVTEKWLTDRSGSSSEAKRVIENQTKFLRRKRRVLLR